MRLILLLITWLLACPALAALVEEVIQLPVQVTDREQRTHQHNMTLTVFRDDARERAPFLLINHGRAGSAAGRAQLGRARFRENAAYFVERGFAVFVPTRVGYGVTGGPDVEYSGPCGKRDFPPAFEAAAVQSLAVIQYAKAQPYVHAARGVVVGQSVGGATTVALAAKNIAGVVGAINFAGGSGGNPDARPDNPCSPHLLARTLTDYGKSARTPMLWLYSENDRFWGKALPRQWFEGYVAQGAPAEFVLLPPSGRDGHGSFTSNSAAWRPHVERFLKAHGFAQAAP